MDDVTTGSRVWGACKWLLAMVGVFGAYMLIQVVVMSFAGVALGVVAGLSSVDYETLLEGSSFDNVALIFAVAAQLIVIAVFLPAWRRMRPASFVARREAVAPSGVSFAKSLATLLMIGVSAQFFVGGLLGVVELLFPEAMAEYSELMEDTSVGVFAIVSALSIAVLAPINEEIVCRGVMLEYAMRAMSEYSELMEDTSVGVFAIVSALSIAVLAPINEEIVCRGVMLEYAMRAMSPGWNVADGARYRAVSARAFWIANTLQALAFGVLHMNLIQGSYAFALGVLEGWVFWRTGKLRYPIILHFALNISSYLVEPLYPDLIQGSYAFALGVLEGWVFWRTGKLRYPIILHFALNISSYLVEPLYPVLSVVPTGLVIVLAVVMCAAGIRGFGRLWSSFDALDAIERPQDVAAVQGILPMEGGVGERPTPPDGYLG